jgi:hypothetical protein
MKKYQVFPILVILLSSQACSPSGIFATPTPTPTPTQTFTPSPTFTPTMTGTPTIQPPGTPEPGYSNVYGRVLWHGEPVVGIGVYLSDFMDGSESHYQELVETDDDGRFVFTRVPPGDDYKIGPRSGNLLELQKEQEGFELAKVHDVSFSVPAGTNFNFGEYYLSYTLVQLEPAYKNVLSEMPTSLSWEAYPEATYYHVQMKQKYGTYTNMVADTTETRLDLELPLLDCVYYWTVVAYNAYGKPIAESDEGIFTIRNDMLPSCLLQLISPGDREIVSDGSSQLDWELHPLADSYTITISKATGSMIWDLSKQTVEIIDYRFEDDWYVGTVIVNEDGSLDNPSPPLPFFGKGRYYWEVKAFTADGCFIASAPSSSFTVP